MYDERASMSVAEIEVRKAAGGQMPASLLIRMVDCFADGNRQEAKEAAAELGELLARGAVSPLYTVHLRAPQADRLQLQLRHVLGRFAATPE